MKKVFILFISIALVLSNAYSQYEVMYSNSFIATSKIKKIKGWAKFEKLTPQESGWHRLMQENNDRIDQRFKEDSLHLPPVSQEQKKAYYEFELKLRRKFSENRSRYFVRNIKNGNPMDMSSFSPDEFVPMSTECICELKNDTINIGMGIWVFGGFFYEISIIKNKYTARYIEDAHERQPFKYTPKDSAFVNHILLPIETSALIIDDPIEFKIDEVINGLFKFETPLYYTDSYYHYEYPSKEETELDEIKTKGKIYFTCKLKEAIEIPEE